MKFSTTLVFFFLFSFVLGAYFYLIPPEVEGPQVSRAPSRPQELVKPREGESIDRIRIENIRQNFTLVLENIEGTWYVKEPFYGKASPLTARGLAAALSMSKEVRRFVPETDLSEYGLEAPDLRVGVGLSSGEPARYLLFGGPAVTGDSVYARWEDEPRVVFLLDESLKSIFQRGPEAFRDRRIFRTPLPDISRIALRLPQVTYEVVRSGAQWRWLEPIKLLGREIPGEPLQQLLAFVQNFFVRDFLDGVEPSADFGFGLLGEGFYVRVWAGGDEPVEELAIGKELLERDAFYAARGEEGPVFLVSRERVYQLFELLDSMAVQSSPPAPEVTPDRTLDS